MSCKSFRLSALALLVLSSAPTSAALYQVFKVTGPSGVEQYGSAIQPSGVAASCFTNACTSSSYQLAGDSRNIIEGNSYREEVPFAVNNGFTYVDGDSDRDNIEDYCTDQLGYSTCNYWATDRWTDWSNEYSLNFSTNAASFLETAQAGIVTDSLNSVVNAITTTGQVIGNTSLVNAGSGVKETRNRAFINTTALATDGGVDTRGQTRAWGTNDTLIVGSASVALAHDYTGCTSASTTLQCQNSQFASKAAVWQAGDQSLAVVLPWGASVSANINERSAQGSARAITDDGSKYYVAGFNTYRDGDNLLMDATVFVSTDLTITALPSTWTSKPISGARVDGGSDYIHSNSVATDINDNLMVIGTAKRSGDFPSNGTANNRLFVAKADDPTVTATFLTGGIFFSSAGGKMGAVNNFNEIVGQVDVENHREFDGKERRKRGFINPYTFATGDVPARRAIFSNKAWLLDDLTNDGSSTSTNNQFRIYDATDINDAGVISGTAFYCSVGYDSTAHDAYCGGANTDEQLVAVKLVPVNGADSSDISARGYVNRTVERQGAGIGLFGLGLLAFLGFRRKFH
ncbi:DUF3466 family protein [Aliivibrio kagoshimensis]|uniref:DUF3466 family protein n=1 Tax=Aliivibrio kagoshimensis TaxID=2910230 RepID=UPI003D0E7A42